MKIAKSITLVMSLLVLLLGTSALGQQPELVSVNRFGKASGAGQSSDATISANGRYVAFQSRAHNLVANDTNGSIQDAFVRDMVNNTTSLVSINHAGTGSGNQASHNPVISADGRYVVFTSEANDLVTNDTNTHHDVFVRDLVAGTTTLASANSAGTGSGNGYSVNFSFPVAMISADGRYVVFQSYANDLVTNDTNTTADIFIRDLVAGTTKLVSVNATGTGSGNSASDFSVISADGRYVAFASLSGNLVNNDFNGGFDIFLRDVVAGTTTLVSVNSAGTASGNAESYFNGPPMMTPDGRFVAFNSLASDLAGQDINATLDVYVRDVAAGKTHLASVNRTGTTSSGAHSGGYSISDDGKLVAFTTTADDMVANDKNNSVDVFVRNLVTRKTTLVSVNSVGDMSGNKGSTGAFISAGGKFVVFLSYATDIIKNDINGTRSDIFIRDLVNKTTTLASVNSAGTASGKGASEAAVISDDGLSVAFQSRAGDLARNDRSTNLDVFAVSLKAGSIQFGAPVYSFGESSGTARITVKRTGGSHGAVSVDFATSDGSATAGQDYTAVSGTLNFANGEKLKTVTIPIIDDSIGEFADLVNLTLSHPTGGALLGARSMAVLDIVDDD